MDSQTGKLIGTLQVTGTGGMTTWKSLTTSVTGATGVHDLFLVFKGSGTGDLFNLDWWQFEPTIPAAIAPKAPLDASANLVDVYTMRGVKIRSRVEGDNALKGLRQGVYLVGTKKVFVSSTPGNP